MHILLVAVFHSQLVKHELEALLWCMGIMKFVCTNFIAAGNESVFRGVHIINTSSINVAAATGDPRDNSGHQCGNKCVAQQWPIKQQ